MLLAFMGLSIIGYSQSACHGFAKKNCKMDFEDYVPNPQPVNAELEAGESAEVSMIFSRDHDYMVYVCTEDHMGEIGFRIKSSKGEILFDNKDYEMTDVWDFSMTSTKRLVIEVTFEGSGSSDGFAETGCAAILVGHKHTTQKGFK